MPLWIAHASISLLHLLVLIWIAVAQLTAHLSGGLRLARHWWLRPPQHHSGRSRLGSAAHSMGPAGSLSGKRQLLSSEEYDSAVVHSFQGTGQGYGHFIGLGHASDCQDQCAYDTNNACTKHQFVHISGSFLRVEVGRVEGAYGPSTAPPAACNHTNTFLHRVGSYVHLPRPIRV